MCVGFAGAPPWGVLAPDLEFDRRYVGMITGEEEPAMSCRGGPRSFGIESTPAGIDRISIWCRA